MSEIAFIRSLPKKPIGTAAIFLNEKKELLIVKPNYTEGWGVPGGTIELNESPTDGCRREIQEEIGLDISELKFLGVNYSRKYSDEGEVYDNIEFTFFGGILTEFDISKIKLQTEELDEFKFCPTEEAFVLLRPRLSDRIKAGLEVLGNEKAIYTEQI